MHSISHWAWLLTGWPCTPLCLDSLSILWHTTETTNRLWKTCAAPRPSSQSSSPPNTQQDWVDLLYVVSAGFTGFNEDLSRFGAVQWQMLHIIVQINAIHPPSVFFFNQSLFFVCVCVCWLVGVTNLYSPSKPEGWPHGASSCHHHSRRS